MCKKTRKKKKKLFPAAQGMPFAAQPGAPRNSGRLPLLQEEEGVLKDS